MTNNLWNEKQLQWQLERHLDFEELSKLDANSSRSTATNTEYHLCNITIKNNQYYFSSFANNNSSSLDLIRNTNYIFDVSDSSNQGYKFSVSRVPSTGKIRDLTYQGIPGFSGSFVSFFIGIGRPTRLYYYDQTTKGMGGKINILDL